MDADDFRRRTKLFGLHICGLVAKLPQAMAAQALGWQLLRSGTSVGANYRAACRARSSTDFISKSKIVEEECDESLYWMEILSEAGLCKSESPTQLIKEGEEILAMVVASIKTTRFRMR